MNSLDEFEQSLSKRLQRVDAPATLADAVMSRMVAAPRPALMFPRRHMWIARLAALLLLTALLAGAGVTGLHHRRAVERAKAEQDFAKSQELISRALEPVRQHLQRAGITLDE